MTDHETTRTGVGAVMVTFNSAAVARRAVECLAKGSLAPEILVIVDNGSEDTRYLDAIDRDFRFVSVVRLGENLGFCAGSNQGLPAVGDRHLMLVNPDAFVSGDFLEHAVRRLDDDPGIGAIGPKLLTAEVATGEPTGVIDSAGIAQTRWGRFFDRGMGEADRQQYDAGIEDMTALCAASVLLRREAVAAVVERHGDLFDEKFFMYKEDIDLSFRLQRLGWRTVYDPSLVVLHCRGWKRDRRAMPAWARRRSLVNEWRLWWRGWTPGRSRWPAVPYLLAKTVGVGLGR